ncbi:MAG: tetratricopeptide (TPR) repeat protein, partial [Verrucomicrobiales bacterium]
MKFFTLLLASLSIPAMLMAQISPRMTATGETNAIPISEVYVEARIDGYLAKTSITLVFKNPHDRVLEGLFVFPIPADGSVSGYALDIKDQMVDGVVVEKDRGRIVFESIVRQGIDPGLIEWTQGNTFKTRVFPIPAKGTRKIRLDYVSKLDETDEGAVYHLPLHIDHTIQEGSLDVEVSGHPTCPLQLDDGKLQLVFHQRRSRETELWSGNSQIPRINLDQDLRILIVESRPTLSYTEMGTDNTRYFIAHDRLDFPSEALAPLRGKIDIGLVWDASASRATADHTASLNLLTRWINDQPHARFTVHLMELRERIRYLESIPAQALQTDELVRRLTSIQYDGASSLESLHRITWPSPPERILLFSDGRATFGPAITHMPEIPVYSFNASRESNTSVLRMLAQSAHGRFFDLHDTPVDEVRQALQTKPVYLFEVKGPVEACYPPVGSIIDQRLDLIGKITKRSRPFNLDILYAFGDGKKKRKTIRIDPERAAINHNGAALPRFWAQQKINDLLIYEQENEDAITALGKAFGIVTPGTSLIVLDNINQYIRHRIRPPYHMPEWQKEYDRSVKHPIEVTKTPPHLSEHVRDVWKIKAAWWRQTRTNPAAFASKDRGHKESFDLFWGEAWQPAPVLPRWPPPFVRMGHRLPPDPGITNAFEQSLHQWTIQDLNLQQVSLTNALSAIQTAASETSLGAIPLQIIDGTNSPYAYMQVHLETNHCSVIQVLKTLADIALMKVVVTNELVRFIPAPEEKGLILRAYPIDPMLFAEHRGAAYFSAGGGGGFGDDFDSFDAGDGGSFDGGFGDPMPSTDDSDDDVRITVGASDTPTPRIHLTRSPPASYLELLQASAPDMQYKTYLSLRTHHARDPVFFLQCSDFFRASGDRERAISILSNLAEMEVDDARLLRLLACGLDQIGEPAIALPIYERVLKLRPEEPQSHRDLALILGQLNETERAIELMRTVVYRDWDRFSRIKEVAIVELNQLMRQSDRGWPSVDPAITFLPDCDLRIVLSWDTDTVDMDLLVTEPSGEICTFSNSFTKSGGRISPDIREGYGPEEY